MIVKIQHRRGSYNDYDPSKVLPGELVVTQSDDPNSSDGEAVYIGTKAGKVKQLATSNELDSKIATALQSAIPEFVDEVTQEAQDAADRAEAAAEHLVTDTTLTVAGRAADAKKTGDEINQLKDDLSEKGFSQDARHALLECFQNVAWITGQGQTYYDNLYNALYPNTGLVRLEAVFTQGDAEIFTTTPLEELKAYLVVTGYYSDGTSKTIQDYTLTGTLTAGTSTVTVSKNGKTTTFNVTVTAWTIEWDYTKGLPGDNGFQVQATGTYTEEIVSDGLNVTTENIASGIVRYRYITSSSDMNVRGVFEMEFEVNSWGSYNNYPYGNGIKLNAGLGERGGNYAKCAELTFNKSGVSYMKAGQQYSWTMIDNTPIELNTLYKVKIEQTLTSANLYLNGTFLGTLDNFYENVGYPQFIVNRGASAKFKAFRLMLTTEA